MKFWAWLQKIMPLMHAPRKRKSSRLEVCWTDTCQRMLFQSVLGVAPKEGGIIALCKMSTGTCRKTILLQRLIPPTDGDLLYGRGLVVSIAGKYLNKAIEALALEPKGTGLCIVHSHPGAGEPQWSSDDDDTDARLGHFMFEEGFLKGNSPLVSLVVTNTHVRGRQVVPTEGGSCEFVEVARIRTVGRTHITCKWTIDGKHLGAQDISEFADRSVRAFGKDGQRLLADIHVAIVGGGGVGSIVADHMARLGIGTISTWDPDIVKAVNINRSSIYTYQDARKGTQKITALEEFLPQVALTRNLILRAFPKDVRLKSELPALLDADLMLMLVDDVRVRHYINRVSFAHYIPVIDGANAIKSTAENDANAEEAVIEGGGVRINHLYPGGPCLWCTGHITSERLSKAYRSKEDLRADRARGYVENLGPEHAPSVMPVNALTAALLEIRLQDYLFGLTKAETPELHYDLLGGTLDRIPRKRSHSCRHCAKTEGGGDLVDLPFADA